MNNSSLKLTADAHKSYKIGVNEIEGMKQALERVMIPIRDALRDKAYWDSGLNFGSLEYKSRDGFIAHSHNFGGIELSLHVPKCEEYDWGFLEFGEMTEEYLRDTDAWENEGELDAYLRIILKFEGVNDDGELEFYINVCGGNNDAPYFRVNQMPDLFEAEFTCRSVSGIKRAATKHIKSILKLIEEK